MNWFLLSNKSHFVHRLRTTSPRRYKRNTNHPMGRSSSKTFQIMTFDIINVVALLRTRLAICMMFLRGLPRNGGCLVRNPIPYWCRAVCVWIASSSKGFYYALSVFMCRFSDRWPSFIFYFFVALRFWYPLWRSLSKSVDASPQYRVLWCGLFLDTNTKKRRIKTT